MNRIIEVVPHDPEWDDIFAQEAELIKHIMGNLIVNIHHIGSTAIPRIKAKPIIDIMPEVSDITKVDSFNVAMEKLGYQAYGEYGLIGRRFFVKFDQFGERKVNAHFYQTGNPELIGHLLFLNYMNSHLEEAQIYSKLKEELAIKFPHDIDSYCNGKDLFIKDILAKAGFNELYLREVRTVNEWFHYHRIRKSEIFEKYFPEVIYDPNHPSITSTSTKHYVLYKGNIIIGTVFTDILDERKVAMRLLAIDAAFQNQGYGSFFVKEIEKLVKLEGYKVILLHANPSAYHFYQQNGYSEMEFIEEDAINSSAIDMGKIL